MPQDTTIEITIDPTLLNHFKENLDRLGAKETPEQAIAELVTNILDGSEFPISAKQTGGSEIRIGYRLRSFSQPFF